MYIIQTDPLERTLKANALVIKVLCTVIAILRKVSRISLGKTKLRCQKQKPDECVFNMKISERWEHNGRQLQFATKKKHKVVLSHHSLLSLSHTYNRL